LISLPADAILRELPASFLEAIMFRRFLLFKMFATRPSCGLLALRLFTALPLFLKHGTEKLFRFQHMAQHFPNPLHIGVVPSLLFATLSDGICTLLLILGWPRDGPRLSSSLISLWRWPSCTTFKSSDRRATTAN
jgi:DoxX